MEDLEDSWEDDRQPGHRGRTLAIGAAAAATLALSTIIAAQVTNGSAGKSTGHPGQIAQPAREGAITAEGQVLPTSPAAPPASPPAAPPRPTTASTPPPAQPPADPPPPPAQFPTQPSAPPHSTNKSQAAPTSSPSAKAVTTTKPAPPPVVPPPPATSAAPKVPGTVNLAAGRPATVTSVIQNYYGSHITDGDVNSYWEANPGFPQSVTIDLGSVQTIGRIQLCLPQQANWNQRTQTIQITGSTTNGGGNDFTIVGSRGYFFNQFAGDDASVDFGATKTRWITLHFTANSGWGDAQLSEIRVY